MCNSEVKNLRSQSQWLEPGVESRAILFKNLCALSAQVWGEAENPVASGTQATLKHI